MTDVSPGAFQPPRHSNFARRMQTTVADDTAHVFLPPSSFLPKIAGTTDISVITDVHHQLPGTGTLPVRPLNRPVTDFHNLIEIDPGLIWVVGHPGNANQGQTRSQLTVPVCPAPAVSDEVIFEDPHDPSKHYYVPRYQPDIENVTGAGQQFRVTLRRVGSPGNPDSWKLAVHLKKAPAPSIEQAARTASELPGSDQVTVILRLNLPTGGGGTIAGESHFQEIVAEAGGISAALNLATLGEMNQVYQALTDASYGAALIVQRPVQVAVLTGARANVTGAVVSSGTTTLRGTWLFDLDAGREGTIGDIWWEQQTAVVRDMHPMRGALIANLGHVNFDSVTAAQLQNLPYGPAPIPGNADASNQLATGDVFAVKTAGGNYAKAQVVTYNYNMVIQWVTYHIADNGEPLYQAVSQTLENRVDPFPFVFPPAVNPNIFGDVTGTGQSLGLTIQSAAWQGTFYRYYQDQSRPYVFYYLPDQVKLVRRSDSPHNPAMSVRFTPGASLNDMRAIVDLIAAPVVDLRRLDDAARTLQAMIGAPLPQGISALEFEPLHVDSSKLHLRLALPPSGQPQDLPVAAPSGLWGGVTGTISLAIADFQVAYAALVSGAISLLAGEVRIDIGDNTSEDVPFALRIADTAGPVFDVGEADDAATGGIAVTLANAIESPVQINQLTATVLEGQTQAPAHLQGLDITSHPSLHSGDTLSFVVVPDQAPPAGTHLSASFDLSGVQVLPNRDAVWDVIMDPTSPGQYTRTIQVQLFAATFAAPPGHPENQIDAVMVQLEHGDSVLLDAGNLTRSATIPLPVSDYVLNKPDYGQYRYRVTVVRNGVPQTDNQWRTDSSDILIPSL